MSFGQGGPSRGPEDSRTPDWAALAEVSAARSQRRKWLFLGGGALATAAVATIVATAVVSAGRGSDSADKNASRLPSPQVLPNRNTEPAPSFSAKAPPPPPNPNDFISSSKKDRAPLNAGTLFPGTRMTMAGRSYAKNATHRTTSCSSVTQGRLGSVLVNNGCGQVIRATYSTAGIAVTVGVAVFDTQAQAQNAMKQSAGGIASLNGGGVPIFCRNGTVCRRTANAYGRYAYFTVGGYASGKNVTKADADVFTAGDDVAEFTFRRIVARGQAQASAAAAAPAS